MPSREEILNVREYLILDSLVQGVPEEMSTIQDWTLRINAATSPSFRVIQERAQVGTFGIEEMSEIIVSLCRAGMVRALVTDVNRGITARVENDPSPSGVKDFFFEITNRGKLRWKTLGDSIDAGGAV